MSHRCNNTKRQFIALLMEGNNRGKAESPLRMFQDFTEGESLKGKS